MYLIRCKSRPPFGTVRYTGKMADDRDEIRIGKHTVRRMGYGAMQLAGPGAFGPPKDRTEALAVLRSAVDRGVNHIDTAQYYGPAVVNELIHEALHPYPDDLILISKVGAKRNSQGAWLPASSPSELRVGVLENLTTLHTDYLAAVNLRLPDLPAGKSVDEQLFVDQIGALAELKQEGIVGGIGLSNIGSALLEAALKITEVVCVQNPFNIIDRKSLEVVRRCEAESITFVPFFPLGSGFSTVNPVLTAPSVTTTAARLGVTPAQVALAWLLDVSSNTAIIPGTSSLQHLEENLAAEQLVLDQQAKIDLGLPSDT